jgi:hypothetical protein
MLNKPLILNGLLLLNTEKNSKKLADHRASLDLGQRLGAASKPAF